LPDNTPEFHKLYQELGGIDGPPIMNIRFGTENTSTINVVHKWDAKKVAIIQDKLDMLRNGGVLPVSENVEAVTESLNLFLAGEVPLLKQLVGKSDEETIELTKEHLFSTLQMRLFLCYYLEENDFMWVNHKLNGVVSVVTSDQILQQLTMGHVDFLRYRFFPQV
jgi:hypothetical protein